MKLRIAMIKQVVALLLVPLLVFSMVPSRPWPSAAGRAG